MTSWGRARWIGQCGRSMTMRTPPVPPLPRLLPRRTMNDLPEWHVATAAELRAANAAYGVDTDRDALTYAVNRYRQTLGLGAVFLTDAILAALVALPATPSPTGQP